MNETKAKYKDYEEAFLRGYCLQTGIEYDQATAEAESGLSIDNLKCLGYDNSTGNWVLLYKTWEFNGLNFVNSITYQLDTIELV